jgi:creatinine deaminase
VLGSGHNQRVQRHDPSAHAEVEACRNAGRRRSYHDTIIATTLAPCWYCSGMIRQSRIARKGRPLQRPLLLQMNQGAADHP